MDSGLPEAHLEVIVTHVRDVEPAQEGGASRLLHVVSGEDDARSPAPADLSTVVREADVPVRTVLRLSSDRTTTGGEFTRLVGLAQEYLALGADGVCFGFLDADLEVDTETCASLVDQVPGLRWTFDGAIDQALEPDRAWRDVLRLPGLDSVRSAGSPRGLTAGFDDLLTRAERHPKVAEVLMPGGGLLAEHVPWFRRLGVTWFHLGAQARPGGSWRAYVDARHVRSWRLLLDGDR
jgi:copper homeostasis protein